MIKRILYIGGFELPDLNAGACRVLNNARIFKNNSIKVDFFGITKNSNSNIDGVILDDYDYHLESVKKKRDFIKYIVGNSFAKKAVHLFPNFDLIICYSLHASNTRWLINYAKKKNIKILIDCVEWDILNKPSIYNLIKNIDTNICMNRLYKKSDGIICISSFLSNHFSNTNKTIVIPPLTFKDDFSKYYFQNRVVNDNELKIVYFGNPGEKEDFSIFTQIVFKARESRLIELHFIGFDEQTFACNYKNEYKILNNSSIKLFFHGQLSHAQTIEIVSICDCSFVFRKQTLKNTAGFPTKFAESVSAQIYTICNNFSDLACYNSLENVFILNGNILEEGVRLISSLQTKIKKIDFVSPFDISFWGDKLIDFINNLYE